MAQKIATLQIDIQKHNSIPSEQEKKIDVTIMMEELDQAVKDLIRLKIIIFQASISMRETILTLAETKSRISFLRGIDTHEGKSKSNDFSHSRGFYDSETSFSAEFDILWVREEVAKCEEQIDKLQDELDVFNHKTDIEF